MNLPEFPINRYSPVCESGMTEVNIKTKKKSKVWAVYILRCSDNTLYTGITNNIEKRFTAHNQGTAAKYTRSRRPVKLMITSAKMDRSEAMRLEIKIKKLPKTKKIDALRTTASCPGKKKRYECLTGQEPRRETSPACVTQRSSATVRTKV
ncbi:MAG: GIY-YIG nuclease family protein [Smithella sp.]